MRIKLFGTLRLTAGESQIELMTGPGQTLATALEALFTRIPALRAEVVEPDRFELKPHVNVMLNGRLVRDLQGMTTPVGEGDTLAVFPPSAGG